MKRMKKILLAMVIFVLCMGSSKAFPEDVEFAQAAADKLSTPKVNLTLLSDTKLQLSWDKINNATYYVIYRSNSAKGTYRKVKTTKGTKYTNSNLNPSTTYYYKVIAYNKKIKSEYSDVIASNTDLSMKNEAYSISIGKVKFSYPISWEDLKKVLKTNNLYNSKLENTIKNNPFANEHIDLDADNGFSVLLKKIDNKIVVVGILLPIEFIDKDKFPVTLDGEINIESRLADVIKIYGKYDKYYQDTDSYEWQISDKRKVRLEILAGWGKDPNQVKDINLYCDVK